MSDFKAKLDKIKILIEAYGVAAGRKNPQNKDDIDKFIVKFVQESIGVVTKIIGENEQMPFKTETEMLVSDKTELEKYLGKYVQDDVAKDMSELIMNYVKTIRKELTKNLRIPPEKEINTIYSDIRSSKMAESKRGESVGEKQETEKNEDDGQEDYVEEEEKVIKNPGIARMKRGLRANANRLIFLMKSGLIQKKDAILKWQKYAEECMKQLKNMPMTKESRNNASDRLNPFVTQLDNELNTTKVANGVSKKYEKKYLKVKEVQEMLNNKEKPQEDERMETKEMYKERMRKLEEDHPKKSEAIGKEIDKIREERNLERQRIGKIQRYIEEAIRKRDERRGGGGLTNTIDVAAEGEDNDTLLHKIYLRF